MNEDIDNIAASMGDDAQDILLAESRAAKITKAAKAVKPTINTSRFGAYARALKRSTSISLAMMKVLGEVSGNKNGYILAMNEQIERNGLLDDAEELNKLLSEMETKWLRILETFDEIGPILD